MDPEVGSHPALLMFSVLQTTSEISASEYGNVRVDAFRVHVKCELGHQRKSAFASGHWRSVALDRSPLYILVPSRTLATKRFGCQSGVHAPKILVIDCDGYIERNLLSIGNA